MKDLATPSHLPPINICSYLEVCLEFVWKRMYPSHLQKERFFYSLAIMF